MKKCLVVDDSKVIRMVASKIVTELGFDAIEAVDGVEAYNSCQDSMPDVILLDWNMPNKNGLEFLRDLRNMPNGGNPIVIFVTTENGVDHIQKALEAGANEYIMKPFDADLIRMKFEQTGIL